MCGIFAYYNWNVPRERRAILQCLVNGLRRLEYRGYDSAGIGVDSHEYASVNRTSTACEKLTQTKPLPARKCIIIKDQGKVDRLEAKIKETITESLDAIIANHCGIAHTRWATHGQPDSRNGHPHTSDAHNEFMVVHNGIITNHRELRTFLIKQGFEFESDTDTEVVPKLTKYLFECIRQRISFQDLVTEVISHLDGPFALIFKSVHYPNELVACKHGSPLILGLKEKSSSGEYFLSSDVAAIVEHTKRAIILEEGDLVHLHNGTYAVYHTMRKADLSERALRLQRFGSGVSNPARVFTTPPQVVRETQVIRTNVDHIMKEGYDHFMLKEIFEQPESLLDSMRGRIDLSAVEDKGLSVPRVFRKPLVLFGGLADHLSSMNRSRRLVFVGCGTSFHAAVAARGFMEEMTEIAVDLQIASDFVDRLCPIFRDDACIFMSQSGETADTLKALRHAKKSGALCVGVTNTVGSAIARETDCGVYIHCGTEIGVASTKAYTSQIVVLTMIALAMAANKIDKADRSEEVISALTMLPRTVRKALRLDNEMHSLASKLHKEKSLLIVGRGYNYATSLETALKIKELAYMHSEGINAGEMKHGPLALIDSSMPVIVVCTKTDNVYPKMRSVIEQLCARHARLILLCTEDDEELISQEKKFESTIVVPSCIDMLQPVVNIIPLQLLSYHITVLRGLNVDQPRNLAKSVTVTE